MSVIIFIENTEGNLKKSAFETLTYGFKTAQQLQTKCIAVTIGDCSASEQEISKYGAEKLICIENDLQDCDNQSISASIKILTSSFFPNSHGDKKNQVLDEVSSNPIVLNDFYESDIDTYKSGKILYPFNSLSPGKHTLKVKVWDVFNNSSEDEIEFVVIKSDQISILNLLNAPNPVIDYTDFYFDHNQDGQELDIILQIIDLQGREVYQTNEKIYPSGNTYGPIRWNAGSQNNYTVLPGTYVYNLVVISQNGEKIKKSGRLILLK